MIMIIQRACGEFQPHGKLTVNAVTEISKVGS